MQADSTIWFAAPRPLPLAGLLPMILRASLAKRGGVCTLRLQSNITILLDFAA